jgi:ubiquitin C-terminal hydrolase
MSQESQDFESCLIHWSQPGINGVIDPEPTIKKFVKAYKQNDQKYLTGQQEAETLFEAGLTSIIGAEKGISHMACMQHVTYDTVWSKTCCGKSTNTTTHLETNAMLSLAFPEDGKFLERAIEEHIMDTTVIHGSKCKYCHKPVEQWKRCNIVDGNAAFVVAVNRIISTPKQKNVMKNDKKLRLRGWLSLPLADSTMPDYGLVATIQHIGSVKSGHYKSHLKKNEQFWCVNDDAAIERSSDDDVSKSQIFIFLKQ